MKVYLVVEYVDLGYFVLFAYTSKEIADAVAIELIQSRVDENEHYNPCNIEVEEIWVVEE